MDVDTEDKQGLFECPEDQKRCETIIAAMTDSGLIKICNTPEAIIECIAILATGILLPCGCCGLKISFLNDDIQKHIAVQCIKCSVKVWHYDCDKCKNKYSYITEIGSKCGDCNGKVCGDCYESCGACNANTCHGCSRTCKEEECKGKPCRGKMCQDCWSDGIFQCSRHFFDQWDQPMSQSSSD